MTVAAWDEDAARAIISRLAPLEGALLPILHALQDEFGYVDPAAEPLIADALTISRAEVFGTIAFYHDFRRKPAGRRVVKICRAEACQANGCEQLLAELRARHGLAPDETTNEELTIETVYCLGNCALGPAALVDGELLARLDADRLAEVCSGGSIASAQVAAGAAK